MTDAADRQNLFEENRANWDDRADVHVVSDDYGVERFVDDPSRLSDVVRFDAPYLGDLHGIRAVHLQCHIGTDTISLARLGATVAGLDLSPKSIGHARELAERTGTPAEFVVGNVYDAPSLLGSRFDLVYTGVGALCWLDDLDRWAAAVAGVLVGGGRLYLRDTHPMLWPFEEIDGRIVPEYAYFGHDDPLTSDEALTYTDGDTSAMTNTRHHEWAHPVSDIVNSLIGAGMVLDGLDEHAGLDWQAVPSAVKEGDQWFLPPPWRDTVPGMLTVRAHKP